MKVVAALASAWAVVGEDVPTWPGPIAPVWPTQFSAPVTGFDNKTSPSNFTGWFYYDWVNNLLRYDSTPVRLAPEDLALGIKPLPNSSRVWIAEPRPAVDFLSHLKPGIYQFNWDTPSCFGFPMPGLSVERPDSFVHVNATHLRREKIDGRWTDYWYYYFNGSSPMGHVQEPFNLWEDINYNWPVRIYGPLSPPDYTEWGETVWKKLVVGAPDPQKWLGLDFTKCQQFQHAGPLANMRSLHHFVHAGKTIDRMTSELTQSIVV